MILPPVWEVTPLSLVALAVGVAHEVGVRRLAPRQSLAHRRQTRRRSLEFYAGLVVLIVVASGPLERWSVSWLTVHMVIHVVEMFYLPPLLIVAGPWVPLLFALPVTGRRRLLRAYYRSSSLAWVRGLASFLRNPILAIVLFNGSMVFWHVPVIFNWASWHEWPLTWLMAPSFIVTGILFWRVILPSRPSPARGSARVQFAAIVVTGLEMLVLAMALSIFTRAPWYSMIVALHGHAAALRDQRWAAGILWICGDFWAIPALVLVGYRIYGKEGGLSASLERALGRA
jgi:cytochrome c oxidase assembly factor CtaG